MQEDGEEIDIFPLKMLFDTLETSEVRLSRKPKMDLTPYGIYLDQTNENEEDEPADNAALPL